MPSVKRSLSLSPELAQALDEMVDEQGTNRSQLVEILLRENPTVQRRIDALRTRRSGRTKKGRSMTELEFLARSAKRQWEKKEAAGDVKILEPTG